MRIISELEETANKRLIVNAAKWSVIGSMLVVVAMGLLVAYVKFKS